MVLNQWSIKNMRKKAPSELRRDRTRREAFLKEKQTVANKVGTSQAMNSKNSQVKGAVSSTPIMTRSRSKANMEIEVPRINDSVSEDLFISPEKCDPSYDSVLSADPSVDNVCLPVAMATHNPTGSVSQVANDSHGSVDLTGDMDILRTERSATPEDTAFNSKYDSGSNDNACSDVSKPNSKLSQMEMNKLMNALKSLEQNLDKKCDAIEKRWTDGIS